MRVPIFIGYDPREEDACAVAVATARRHAPVESPVQRLVLADLQRSGLYRRPFDRRTLRDGAAPVMWDLISEAPMSTEHACARFLVPHLDFAAAGWAMFADGDVLVRGDLGPLFRALDPAFALYCVKHRFDPPAGVKMDGQEQTRYARKNWSSVMIFNCGHPANARLTIDMVNSVPGRDLHRFCWLDDADIGGLDPSWNFLVGHSDPEIDPGIVHFTEGCPDMPGYENVPYAKEWRRERDALLAIA